MFGTFEAERADVDIVYGLVDQPQFWNPVKHQVSDFLTLHVFNISVSDILLRQGCGEGKGNE